MIALKLSFQHCQNPWLFFLLLFFELTLTPTAFLDEKNPVDCIQMWETDCLLLTLTFLETTNKT